MLPPFDRNRSAAALPDGFERTVWARLEPNLARPRRGWLAWFVYSPARVAWVAAVLALVADEEDASLGSEAVVAALEKYAPEIPLVVDPAGYALAGLLVVAATIGSLLLVRRQLDRLDPFGCRLVQALYRGAKFPSRPSVRLTR